MYGLLAPKAQFVATENCPWRKKTMQGEVHDDNPWTLGGYAGHAGIFSTARETVMLLIICENRRWPAPPFLSALSPPLAFSPMVL